MINHPTRNPGGTSIISLALVSALSALVVVGVYEIRGRLSKRHPETSGPAPESEGQDPPGVKRVLSRIGSGETCAVLRSRYFLQCPTGETLSPLGLDTQERRSAASMPPEREQEEMNRVAEWVKPPKDVLVDMAKRCEVRLVSPAIMENQAPTVDDEQAAALSLSASERAELDQTLRLMRDQFADSVRPLFVSGTTDSNMPSSLDEMITEMQTRENSGFVEARRKLALERASIASPPAPGANLPAGERFLRLWAGLGDEFEQRLTNRLSADRARQLRFSPHSGAWTSRYAFAGCPSPE